MMPTAMYANPNNSDNTKLTSSTMLSGKPTMVLAYCS